MSANRQDAWRKEEDQFLIEVTLQQIREGGTQLSAFEEVGRRLGRTPNACGFRWNSMIRKRVEKEIMEAKRERAKGKKRDKGLKAEEGRGEESKTDRMVDRPFSFDEIMGALQWHKRRWEEAENERVIRDARIGELLREMDHLTLEIRRMTDQTERVREENQRLKAENQHLLRENRMLHERLDRSAVPQEGDKDRMEAAARRRRKTVARD